MIYAIQILGCLVFLAAAGGTLSAQQTIWVDPAADGADSGPAIRDAIHRAVAAGPGSQVRLRAEAYRVSSSADDDWFLVFAGQKNLTLAGEPGRTQIIFTDPRKGGILVPGATGVTIRDLIIDYDPPPFTQGEIIGVNPQFGEFDLRLDAGYPSPDAPWFATGSPVNQMAVLLDADQRRLKRGAPDHFFVSAWREVKPRVWTLRLSDAERAKAASPAPGDRFVLLSRRGNGAFLFAGTTDCLLENVTVHASPSLTVSLTGSTRMTIRRLSVINRSGATRLIASNGDGIHCQQNRLGPLIEGCLFEGLCDDGVNIYTPPLILQKMISTTQIELRGGVAVRDGDQLQIFDPQQGLVRAEPIVITVVQQDGMQIVTLDRPVDGMVAGADHRTADTVYNLSASGGGYVIRNNHFRDHRRFGLLLRGGQGVVEGNIFEELGASGIGIGNEPTWPEGPAASNIVIRGNRFIGGAYTAGYGDGQSGPGISVFGLSLNGLARPALLRDIRIEGNRFTRAATPAIVIRSVKNGFIRDNRSVDADNALVDVAVDGCEAVEVDSTGAND